MISVNVYSDHSVVELGVGTLQNFIVLMLFVIQGVQAFKDEVEESSQVFRGWCSYKDVAKSIDDSASDRNS